MFKDKKMSEFCDQMKDFIDIKKSLYLDYEDIEKENEMILEEKYEEEERSG